MPNISPDDRAAARLGLERACDQADDLLRVIDDVAAEKGCVHALGRAEAMLRILEQAAREVLR